MNLYDRFYQACHIGSYLSINEIIIEEINVSNEI